MSVRDACNQTRAQTDNNEWRMTCTDNSRQNREAHEGLILEANLIPCAPPENIIGQLIADMAYMSLRCPMQITSFRGSILFQIKSAKHCLERKELKNDTARLEGWNGAVFAR